MGPCKRKTVDGKTKFGLIGPRGRRTDGTQGKEDFRDLGKGGLKGSVRRRTKGIQGKED